MMFTSFSAECDSSSRCSASPVGDNLYYPSPAGSYSSMGSPQSQVCLHTCCKFGFTLHFVSLMANQDFIIKPIQGLIMNDF